LICRDSHVSTVFLLVSLVFCFIAGQIVAGRVSSNSVGKL